MTKYIIKPGIAALVDVYCEEFPEQFAEKKSVFICMAPNKLPVKGCSDPIGWDSLPLEVQSQINKHFGQVFSLLAERRQEYLDSFKGNPIVVEA